MFKMSKSANPNPGLTGFDHARSPRLTGLMEMSVRILGRDRVPVKMVVKTSDTIDLANGIIYAKTMIPPGKAHSCRTAAHYRNTTSVILMY